MLPAHYNINGLLVWPHHFGSRAFIFFASIFFIISTGLGAQKAQAVDQTQDRQKVARQTAHEWIAVGKEQYSRGLYKQAEDSFLLALTYQDYLSSLELAQIGILAKITDTALVKRADAQKHIVAAENLFKKDRFIEAKAHLEKVKAGNFLTKKEKAQIAQTLNTIDKKLAAQRKELMEVYKASVAFYSAGQYEKARDGFVEVAEAGLLVLQSGKNAEDYLIKINELFGQSVESLSSIRAMPDSKDNIWPILDFEDKFVKLGQQAELDREVRFSRYSSTHRPLESSDSAPSQSPYIRQVMRKRNILRSYVRAVVNDASVKVETFLAQGKPAKAKKIVQISEAIVNGYHSYLGDELLRKYKLELERLEQKIAKQPSTSAQ
ncbi:MAG: hypothetical protein JXB29_10450 [Sedimentisphaerales bacterium]|nr:hypothetical protein [Sedimentisphaerales bacterium]